MCMIEKANPQDYQQIQNIALTCFKNTIADGKMLLIARFLVKNYFKSANIASRLTRDYELFVIRQDRIVTAFIEIQNKNHISNIFVLPNKQRSGYGRLLIEFAIDYCRLNGSTQITLDAIESAIRFYVKMGFASMNRMKKLFGITTIMMKKDIKDV